MVVFHKLAIYSIKLLAKPIVTGVQKRHTKFSNSFDSYSAKFFIWIGKQNFKINTFLNRKIMGIKTDSEMFDQPINVEVALNKGVEIFWAGFLYSFLIIVSFFEYRKYSQDQQLKAQKELEEKQLMKDQIEDLQKSVKDLKFEQNEYINYFRNELKKVQKLEQQESVMKQQGDDTKDQ